MNHRPSTQHPQPSRTPAPGNDTRPIAVIKLGGSALASADALAELQALVDRETQRSRIVLVHGGSPEISFLYRLAGLPTETIDGLRVTTASGAALVTAALCGLVAPRIVGALDGIGRRAVAVSGLDAGLLRAEPLDRGRLGQVGSTPRVGTGLLRGLLDEGTIPVVAPLARGPEGETLNVNGDVAAAAIARAVGARRLDLVTTGPLRNARGDCVAAVPSRRLRALIQEGVATDGMIPKLSAAAFALERGDEHEPWGPAVPVARVGGFADFASGRATRIESALSGVPSTSLLAENA